MNNVLIVGMQRVFNNSFHKDFHKLEWKTCTFSLIEIPWERKTITSWNNHSIWLWSFHWLKSMQSTHFDIFLEYFTNSNHYEILESRFRLIWFRFRHLPVDVSMTISPLSQHLLWSDDILLWTDVDGCLETLLVFLEIFRKSSSTCLRWYCSTASVEKEDW